MRSPREPRAPDLPAGASGDAASSAEPFVRLSTLAPRERERAGARGEGTTYEERAGTLIRRALAPEGLDGESLERLWGRFDGDEVVRRRKGPGFFARWAVAAVVLLVSGGFVGAETGAWTWPRSMVRKLTGRSAPDAPTPAVAPARLPPRKRAAARPAFVAPVVPAGPAEASPPGVDPGAAEPAASGSRAVEVSPRSDGRRRHVPGGVQTDEPTPTWPPPVPVAAIENTALAEESLLLGRALTRLRQERDPTTALAELDGYAARFPSGVLFAEADRARVDALLMAGRLPDARTVLSNLILGNGARDNELRLIRAELVGQKACAAALADYDLVLTDSQTASLAARALWGRATCRARLGDEAGARSDLAAYLSRFPNGPRAAAARERLRN